MTCAWLLRLDHDVTLVDGVERGVADAEPDRVGGRRRYQTAPVVPPATTQAARAVVVDNGV